MSFSFHFICRLSALTSSKLRDNNPNLTDLSDANRPTKISEMFSELYDNEWTDAYDELSPTNGEAVKIQHLNGLLMVMYFCCVLFSKLAFSSGAVYTVSEKVYMYIL